MRKMFRKFMLLVLLLSVVAITQGCRSLFVNDPEKKAMKNQQKADKDFDQAYAKIRKEHFKNQTRETRKRMKKSNRAAKKMNKPKKVKSKKGCF